MFKVVPPARWLALAFVGSICLGCAPTLSKPRGKEHLAALDEGERHASHGRDEEAAAAFARAAETAKRRVDRDEALYRESRMYAQMGDYERALALCEQIAAVKPPSRRTRRAILDGARYRFELGQHEQAELEMRTLIRKAPESGEALSALRALILRFVDPVEPEDGLAYLAALVGEVPKTSAVYEAILYRRAQLLADATRKAEARDTYEELVERFPYPKGRFWDNSLVGLAQLALEQGQPKAAIGYLEDMLSVHESSFVVGSYTRPTFPKAALTVARIYRDELHDSERAVAAYARAAELFPESLIVDDALTEIAEIRLAEGDVDGACRRFRAVVKRFDAGQAARRAREALSEHCGEPSAQ